MSTAKPFPAHHRRLRLSPTAPGIWLLTRPGLDCLVEWGPRGGVRRYWRRADRREGPEWLVSTWDLTQRAALAR